MFEKRNINSYHGNLRELWMQDSESTLMTYLEEEKTIKLKIDFINEYTPNTGRYEEWLKIDLILTLIIYTTKC